MALSSLWEHLTPAPNYSLLQGNQFNTKLRNYSTFFIKTDRKMWFGTPQCSGHTKDLGELFWQSPGNARSWVGTRGDSWEAQLGLPGEFFHTLPEHSRWESGAPTTAGVPLKLPGQGRDQLCLPGCPGGGFCSAECLANLTPAWKGANHLTKVFSAFLFSVHAALS